MPKLAKVFKLNIKTLEREFYNEKNAESIYKEPNPTELLKLAEEKAKYFKIKKAKQGNLNF